MEREIIDKAETFESGTSAKKPPRPVANVDVSTPDINCYITRAKIGEEKRNVSKYRN